MKKHAAVYGDTHWAEPGYIHLFLMWVCPKTVYIHIPHQLFLYPYNSIHIPYQLFFVIFSGKNWHFETLNFQTRPAGQAEESDLLHAPGRMWCGERRRKTGQRVNGEHVIG